MDRKLSLIKSTEEVQEKRVFPRFPIGLMIFKDQAHRMTFEVKDISLTGMQLELKDGAVGYNLKDTIFGSLHWRSDEVKLGGKIQWKAGSRIGVMFEENSLAVTELKNFLSLDNIVSHIRPIHENQLQLEIPNGLKYWLKADGVLEIFVWELPRSGISKFQIHFMETFIEWVEGEGLRTGKIKSERNVETPLSLEDELIFSPDEQLDSEKIHLAKRVLGSISLDHIQHLDREFLLYKLKM